MPERTSRGLSVHATSLPPQTSWCTSPTARPTTRPSANAGTYTLDIDYEATASDGSPGSGGGSGFDPKSKGLSLESGTLTDRYDEASGAAPRSATCVVVTDTLGRRFATRALRVPAFEERTFWGVAFLHDAPLDHVTAFDASGHVVAFERPSL
ncbi:MAG TPA: hypothetical protein VHD87_07535 [Acidimicrobiales bacterium]|nr:hypothetical protein [Acidimicrobiales bacterium]